MVRAARARATRFHRPGCDDLLCRCNHCAVLDPPCSHSNLVGSNRHGARSLLRIDPRGIVPPRGSLHWDKNFRSALELGSGNGRNQPCSYSESVAPSSPCKTGIKHPSCIATGAEVIGFRTRNLPAHLRSHAGECVYGVVFNKRTLPHPSFPVKTTAPMSVLGAACSGQISMQRSMDDRPWPSSASISRLNLPPVSTLMLPGDRAAPIPTTFRTAPAIGDRL